MNQLKGWKTVSVNIATLIIVAGGALTGQITDGRTLAIIASVVAIANIMLRILTNTAVFKQN